MAARLALVIIRAGSKDSLAWWEDESFMDSGRFVLDRLFPREPGRVALKLAFAAADARHAGVLAAAGISGGTTLLDLARESLITVGRPTEGLAQPISSLAALAEHLKAVSPELRDLSVTTTTASVLDLTDRAAELPALRHATLLASGYLASDKGRLVVPFVRTNEAA